ncbi:hypothetical protein GN956_G18870 [Arapaima gigas]
MWDIAPVRHGASRHESGFVWAPALTHPAPGCRDAMGIRKLGVYFSPSLEMPSGLDEAELPLNPRGSSP